MTELKGTVLDLENKTEKFLEQIGERVEKMQSKVDRMEEGQILREYTDEKCKSVEDLLSKKISTLKAKSEKKIEEIYKNHLLKEGLIGEDEKCTFKSLMDYTTSKIPDLAKRQAQFNAQHEKMTELIR